MSYAFSCEITNQGEPLTEFQQGQLSGVIFALDRDGMIGQAGRSSYYSGELKSELILHAFVGIVLFTFGFNVTNPSGEVVEAI